MVSAIFPTTQPDFHQPVMLTQALDLLNVRPGFTWVDATAGAGGHLREMVRRAPGSTVIGIDRDSNSLLSLAGKGESGAKLVHANFSEIESVLNELGCGAVNGGILADLGVSSMQLDRPERGFSFLREGPLDMRMDTTQTLTARDLVNDLSERELADILFKYGEEKASRRIARRIVGQRPITTTRQLASLISTSLPARGKSRSGFRDVSHPATRTFQALRIAVNRELECLEKFLHGCLRVLSPGGRLAVITFHSLEDRLVKHFFRQAAAGCICPARQPVCTCKRRPELLIITKKPVVPSPEEVLANTRSRSAKLRVGERIS